jgi:hypothetical protein
MINSLRVQDVWDAIGSMPASKIVHGIAMSPQTYSKLRVTNWNTSPRIDDPIGTFAGVPFIVDPRLRDEGEVYYDKEAWNERLKEQNAFDAK